MRVWQGDLHQEKPYYNGVGVLLLLLRTQTQFCTFVYGVREVASCLSSSTSWDLPHLHQMFFKIALSTYLL